MHRSLLLLLVVALAAPWSFAQPAPVDAEAVAEVERLGQLLYAYDRSAALATASLHDLIQKGEVSREDFIQSYVAAPTAEGWSVGFGQLAADRSVFRIVVEVALDEDLRVAGVEVLDEPEPGMAAYRDGALAIEAAMEQFVFDDLPYVVSVIPAGEGALFVYVMPAQTEPGVFPLGADVRYRFDPAIGRITEEIELHSSVQFLASELDGELVSGTLSVAISRDIPAETAVRLAMYRRPPIPHYVVAGEWVFEIDPGGTIHPIPADDFGASSPLDEE